MDSKKLKNTVRIGIITKIEMKREDIYQKFILIIYNPPYKNESICDHTRRKETSSRSKYEHYRKFKDQILLGYAEPP